MSKAKIEGPFCRMNSRGQLIALKCEKCGVKMKGTCIAPICKPCGGVDSIVIQVRGTIHVRVPRTDSATKAGGDRG